ncbi:lysosomal cobalamin transporter ABCD4-like isoform X1 [Dermacentor albipictus]|uniref:lysosomal cobalamin transporter ABCD4-like isoform X1 n=1 Tax=Dermacentor albipictus TaxID=60249 RepID=UPI0031FCDA4E
MSSGTYQRITSINVGPPRHVEPSESSSSDMERLALDCLFFRRFRRLAGIVLSNVAAVLVMVVLLVLSVAYEVIVYQVGLTTSQFYVVLGKKHWWGFLNQTAFCLGLIALVACIKSAKQYVSSTVTVQWRQLLTKRLQELYFSRKVHYRVNVVETAIDNPDQRITQDVDRLCQVLSDIVPTLLISPFTIAYYSYQSFSVAGYIGPLAVFVYFIISTVVSKLLITRVVPRVYELEKQEGRFRYKHTQIRANSESVAFLDGEFAELDSTEEHLLELVKAQQSVYNRQFPLNLGVYFTDYAGSILSFLIIAVPLFSGAYDDISTADLSGIISKNTFVSMYLISCFSKLVDLSSGISTVAGNTHRISVLLERMEAINEEDDLMEKIKQAKKPHGDDDTDTGDEVVPQFILKNMSYGSPYDDNIFVEGLTLELSPPKSVFVTGPSNSGKTSLLRILKGLWSPSSGSVIREFGGSLFLPQVTWFGSGSLRSQLYYPYTPPRTTPQEEGEIWRLIELADLGHLLKRSGGLDSSLLPMWYESLSPGERQRLSFLRVLCQRPKMALLDEATSALDEDTQVKLYRECRKLGIATVTIGHHACLEPLHDTTLELHGAAKGGTWTLKESDQANRGDSAAVDNSHS